MFLMLIYIILAIFFLWLLILTWQLYKTKNHYRFLVKKTGKGNLDEIIEKMLKNDEHFFGEIQKISHNLIAVTDRLKLSIQKIGLLKFNPFERDGIGQSFVMSLLDDKETGVIINFIQTKDGLRVYPKKVKEGKGLDYDLTDEEKKVIEKSRALY